MVELLPEAATANSFISSECLAKSTHPSLAHLKIQFPAYSSAAEDQLSVTGLNQFILTDIKFYIPF